MQKKVFFENSSAERLAGILHTPKKKTYAAAVICHGYGSSKDNKEKWAEAFCKREMAALRFDFSGRGESKGAFEDMTISKLVDDLVSAIY